MTSDEVEAAARMRSAEPLVVTVAVVPRTGADVGAVVGALVGVDVGVVVDALVGATVGSLIGSLVGSVVGMGTSASSLR